MSSMRVDAGRVKKLLITRWMLWVIILLTFIALLVDVPRFPLKVSIGPLKVNTEIGGYNIDFYAFNRWWTRDLSLRRGLDLQGGAHLVLRADMTDIDPADRQNALEAARTVIQRRVDFFGVAEPVIQTSVVGDEHRLLIELPGVVDVGDAIALVGRTAQLEFREVIEASASAEEDVATESGEVATDSAAATPSAEELLGQLLPTYVTLENTRPTGLTGAELKRADPGFDSTTGQPVVNIEFNADGAKLFAEVTRRNVNKPLAMFLDDEPIMNPPPIIQPSLAGDTSGRAVISGQFTAANAKELSIQLRAGALPVPIEMIEQRQVGPTLGEETVGKSVVAGAVGLVMVMMFMAFSYGRLGLIADFSLFLYALLVLAIFKLWPITLTLAGVAGFILSVGMAVDANILIFERMREERRWGSGVDVAVRRGFNRAWTSIRDSNISSLITTFILFQFGTGLVRGFAITLAIGILVSMFTAIVVTRTFIRLLPKV